LTETTFITVFVLVVLVLGVSVAVYMSKRTVLGYEGPSVDQENLPPKPTKDIYLGIRNLALHSSREKIGIAAMSSPSVPWGVVMDWGLLEGEATIVALADGGASVYWSSGGGWIGGQNIEPVHKAAQKAVAIAAEFVDIMTTATVFPLPERGNVIFYFLTDNGVVTTSGLENDLREHRHPLSKLGDAIQEVITQFHRHNENAKANNGEHGNLV
jgi:hypothetical protein